MAITRPAPRLCASVPLSFVRHGSGGRKRVDAAIALIPFIDFLLTVVVFLLMAFSASGEIPLAAVVLPEASNGADVEHAPVIAVDASVVTVAGQRVADTPSLMSEPRLERIDGLVTRLEDERTVWEQLHAGQEFPGRVIVQIDRDLDYRVVRKVLFSAAQAGYANVELAVRVQ